MVNLDRFLLAQEDNYERALQEVKNGNKTTHWMWYIFPQIIGLGSSSTAEYYAIKSIEEAKNYLNDEVLGSRLKEISSELLKLETNIPVLVFGEIDALKLRSSMTLFDYVSENDSNIFIDVLDKYYDGKKDDLTIEICNRLSGKSFKR